MALFGQAREVFAEHFGVSPTESYNGFAFILIGLLCFFLIWVLVRYQREYSTKEPHERDMDGLMSVLRVLGLVALIFAFFHSR